MPAVGFRALKFEQVIKTRLAIAKTFLFIPWLPFGIISSRLAVVSSEAA